MTINIFLLIIWAICGIMTFVAAAMNRDHNVSVWSYACCWAALMIELIKKING